jgi:hypothetical protein
LVALHRKLRGTAHMGELFLALKSSRRWLFPIKEFKSLPSSLSLSCSMPGWGLLRTQLTQMSILHRDCRHRMARMKETCVCMWFTTRINKGRLRGPLPSW